MADSTSLNTITLDGKTQTVSDYEAVQNATKKTTSNSSLGKDAFLQLLVAQMRYQDPLNPADGTEYMSQLAQFSSLEQMTNLNETMSTLSTSVSGINSSLAMQQYASLIGKTVSWTTSSTNSDGNTTSQSLSGKVTGVKMVNNSPVLVVTSGNQTYQVSSGITEIKE
jgi:flagellar basal-body rod modification protein FlgD